MGHGISPGSAVSCDRHFWEGTPMNTTLELARTHAAAEDHHDASAAVATFTEDCVYTVAAFGMNLRGKEQITQHYQGTFSAFPDFYNREVTWFDAGEDVFGRALVEFTHDKEWNGLPPTGKRVSFWSIAHFPRAKDGLLLGEHVYMNGNEFLCQLGALPSANAFEIAAYIRGLETKIADLQRKLAAAE
jgi:steroid delta-isomerase-like uncharacterized protein